jgi:hypothetical protein
VDGQQRRPLRPGLGTRRSLRLRVLHLYLLRGLVGALDRAEPGTALGSEGGRREVARLIHDAILGDIPLDCDAANDLRISGGCRIAITGKQNKYSTKFMMAVCMPFTVIESSID